MQQTRPAAIIRPSMRRIAGFIAIVIGLVLTWHMVQNYDGTQAGRVIVPLFVAGLLTYADQRRPFERWLPKIADYFRRHKYKTAAVIFVLSCAYFTGSAILCQRAFHPTWHDDQMHAVQVQMLAKGYLWRAPHPLAEFFDTFHIFVRPVYAPIHFPGTAILNVAGIWLGLNWSVIPIILTSLGCALLFLILVELVDGIAGLIGVVCFWGSSNVRMLATMITSHNAMLFLGPLMIWLLLRWRKKPTIWTSAWLGLAVALAGFTRPVDALAYAVPIGIYVLYETIRHARQPRRWAYVAIMVIVGLPLVGLQLAFDKNVTGKWLYPPYQAYNDEFHPYTSYGGVRESSPDAPPVKVSDLPQKQYYYEIFMLAQAKEFTARPKTDVLWNTRIPLLLDGALPSAWYYLFVPLGFIGIRNGRLAVLAAGPVLMLLFYLPHVFFLPHYAAILIPGMVLLAVLGFKQATKMLQGRYPSVRTLMPLSAMMTGAIACTPFTMFGSTEHTTKFFYSANFVQEAVPKLVQKPALVFCRISGPDYNPHDEPVYNTGAAWPDDAEIVLAQSLGPHNAELIRYYHELGQNRHVYEFDRNTKQFRSYGTVESITRAAENRKNASTPQPTTSPQE